MTSKPTSSSTLPSKPSARNFQRRPEVIENGAHGLSLLPFQLRKGGDQDSSSNAVNGCLYGLKIKHDNPHYSYRPIFALGHSGDLVMAISRTNPFRQPLPIKKTLIPQDFDTRKVLVQVCHPKIVRVMEVFYYGSSIFSVYEKMEISLQQIAALPFQLEEHQVATICSEVRSNQS